MNFNDFHAACGKAISARELSMTGAGVSDGQARLAY